MRNWTAILYRVPKVIPLQYKCFTEICFLSNDHEGRREGGRHGTVAAVNQTVHTWVKCRLTRHCLCYPLRPTGRFENKEHKELSVQCCTTEKWQRHGRSGLGRTSHEGRKEGRKRMWTGTCEHLFFMLESPIKSGVGNVHTQTNILLVPHLTP